MKTLIVLTVALLFAACSTPKYTYHFDHYDYNHEMKKVVPLKHLTAADKKTLVASTDEKMVYVTEQKKTPVVSKKEIAGKIEAVSKEERKELKKEIKKFVKESEIKFESSPRTSNISRDIKFAAISGGVGIILLIIGGTVLFILGVALILVGFYFLIRWLSHP